MLATIRTIVDDVIRAIIVVIIFIVLVAASLVGLAFFDISGHCNRVENATSTIVVCAMPVPHYLLGGTP